MPPHKLKSTFTSYTFNPSTRVLQPDGLGNFDLTSIEPNGTIGAGCRRSTGQPITGQAREIDPDPIAYQIDIDQTLPVKVQYRGIALFDANGEITSIAGFLKFIQPFDPNVVEHFGLRAEQDETTWVVTKP